VGGRRIRLKAGVPPPAREGRCTPLSVVLVQESKPGARDAEKVIHNNPATPLADSGTNNPLSNLDRQPTHCGDPFVDRNRAEPAELQGQSPRAHRRLDESGRGSSANQKKNSSSPGL